MKIFICDICDSEFGKPYDLDRHKKIHLAYENRELECPEGCGSRFNQRGQVTAHVDAKHKKRRAACLVEGCIASFSDKANLTRHRQKVHGAPTRAQIRASVGNAVNAGSSRSHKRPTDNINVEHQHSRAAQTAWGESQVRGERNEVSTTYPASSTRKVIRLSWLPVKYYKPPRNPHFPRPDPSRLFGKSNWTDISRL